MKVLVTGVAGFIGMHCAQRLLARGDKVLGIDNLSSYYSVRLKKDRLKQLPGKNFTFEKLDVANSRALQKLYRKANPDRVLHLAAQPGVRYSLENPAAYVSANVVGFANLLECCRQAPPQHLVFASSSSVYGANTELPWSETQNVDHPVSVYAATKKSNELMAHVYSHLYGIPATGLRYFTVYGPWGRPDMAIFAFTKAIIDGTPIRLFNYGKMQRDFTYIDDVTRGILRIIDHVPGSARGEGASPARIYNIGNNRSEDLMDVVTLLEKELGREAVKLMLPMQPGDVLATFADIDDLRHEVGFRPETSIEVGVRAFVAWYRDHYRI
jgi:UDP-glucuronate 4-epimerase